jgi:hypothetical protein
MTQLKQRLMSACHARLQVISFAGELLSNAEGLLRDGLHTSEVADGYTKAAEKVGACMRCGAVHLEWRRPCSST